MINPALYRDNGKFIGLYSALFQPVLMKQVEVKIGNAISHQMMFIDGIGICCSFVVTTITRIQLTRTEVTIVIK